MQNFWSLGAPLPDPQSSSLIANFRQQACSVKMQKIMLAKVNKYDFWSRKDEKNVLC